MKLAVISDVHGNYKALEAFLKYIEEYPVDGIICLGDYVTDSPYPPRTIKLLHEMMEAYDCYVLRGNREDYLIQNFYKPQGWHPSSPNGALYYTAKHITKKDIHFFETLPTEKTLEFPGLPSMTICHGAPGIVRGNFELDRVLKEKVMKELGTPWLLGGHSHHQEIDVLFGKTYLNPGSLGLSIDGQGRHAQFAVLTGEDGEWQAQLATIDYDVDSFLQDFAESGLDEYGMVLNRAVKKTLVTGENYFFQCVRTVQEMTGLPLHKIPEEVWQEAGNKLGL